MVLKITYVTKRIGITYIIIIPYLYTELNGMFLQPKSNANLLSIKQKMHTSLKTYIANEKSNVKAVQFFII